MTGPAAGEPDPGWAASPRTGSRDGAVGVLGLLAAGLAFRLIIAYLLPHPGGQTPGFGVDIGAFQYWAENLASQGLGGFYERDFFHDYTPGYLYVLFLVGKVGQLLGGAVGDLIKLPPILADVALGWLVWSMARELGASTRAARIGAAIAIFNPVSWFDSTVWGQVDSVGTLVLLLALRELWRDRPERSAVLTVVAALIKPQLGILIPIVAVVVIRRALRPDGGYGDEPQPVGGATAWERGVHGPIRILTTALSGLVTAIALSLPFGLSLPGLVRQVFATAGGYPYVSVNAYNPWALVTVGGNGIAANRQWLCDATVVPSSPVTIQVGGIVLWSSPGSSLACQPGVMVGALPAIAVGALLFLVVAAVVVGLVARRPDPRTMLVGLAVLALAFFVLPTRVHERYLYPLVGIGAILAAVSLRWRVAYVVSAAATFANLYAVLTSLGYETPGITDWFGIGPALTSTIGVALAAIAQVVVLVWAFAQLREDRLEELAEEIRGAERAPFDGAPLAVRAETVAMSKPGVVATSSGSLAGAAPAARQTTAARPSTPSAGPAAAARVPVWDDRMGAAEGIVEWFRERMAARPVRADRTGALQSEGGGRLDRLDLWVIAVLVLSTLTIRMWRLSEPYGMHFDEVYHARTATEFLQDWRYGLSHDIYEWTHPHLAKYAMAFGLEAFGQDRTGATSELGTNVSDAVIEPRWDPGLDSRLAKGDRLWVATGSEVRAYDLSTRAIVATLALPGATAVTVDKRGHRVFVGLARGDIETIDTLPLDDARAAGTTGALEAFRLTSVGGPIERLVFVQDPSALAAVVPDGAKDALVVVDPAAASELHRTSLPGITQVIDAGDGRIAVADRDGLVAFDAATGVQQGILRLEGPVAGVARTSDLTDNPLYVSVRGPTGPLVDTACFAPCSQAGGDTTGTPHKDKSFTLPGDTAGWVFYDNATRMVHVLGSVPGDARTPTVYVIEPHANAVYADAALPAPPVAIVMDENDDYPITDRQQLLALASDGQVGSVEIGDHALAWRIPGVLAGVLMGALIYVLARLLFRRRWIAGAAAFLVAADGMLFAQSRIGMNDSYVGLGIVAAYVLFAALWLRPSGTRRGWAAFWLGIPLLGVILGLALASKWVAAYAIGGLGLLVLARSALGRLVLIAGLIVLTTVLGYLAISVPEGQTGGNYLFLFLMIGLTLGAVVANMLHPIAWTWEEERLTYLAPAAAGVAVLAYGFSKGDPAAPLHLGPVVASPLELAFVAFVGAGLVRVAWSFVGTLGFGPRALPPVPGDPTTVLDPAAPAPRGWLRLGAAWGVPTIWLVLGLIVIPIGVYIVSYIPWAMVQDHRLWADMSFLGFHVASWPPGHQGDTLIKLTGDMYHYHNTLSAAHPASSPWWAWPFDFKPVWFYEDGFAGGTSASIYDAGNLVLWWLSIPAMAFVAFQAFKRRSAALALLAIGFACQWLSWSRIDRAAFQYHYYTSLPFVILALGYFLAELWNGASKRTWLLARVAAAVAVLAPFGLWLLHRPLCAVVRVTDVNPGSQACPTLIPDLTITPRAVAIAAVVGIGVLLLVRVLVTLGDDDETGASLGDRLRSAALVAVGVAVALGLATFLFKDTAVMHVAAIPVEPIALVVTLALLPVAAIIVTARDARRYVIGALGAVAFWFVLWYPNISALPLPSNIHNAFQGLLPTYVYPFQFPVSTLDRSGAGPNLFDVRVAALLITLTVVAVVVGYSAWTWRIVLAERRREEAGWGAEEAGAG